MSAPLPDHAAACMVVPSVQRSSRRFAFAYCHFENFGASML
ncbi:hypothetical protein GCK32_020858, partial [Trichostrongylus colubriformis]